MMNDLKKMESPWQLICKFLKMEKYGVFFCGLFFVWVLFSCTGQGNSETYSVENDTSSEIVVVIDSHAVKSLPPTPRIERIEYNVGEGDSIVYNMLESMTVDDVYDYYEGLDHAGFAYSDLNFQIKYIDFLMEIFEEALLRRGYKKPTEMELRDRFREFFGIEIDAPNEALYDRALGRYVSDKGNIVERRRQIDFMKTTSKTNFFESVICNKECGFLILNPDLYGIIYVLGTYVNIDEETIYKKGDTIAYNINHYDITLALYRSEYVFHNSESAFNWLYSHDDTFLKDLCCKYDYDGNPRINWLVVRDMNGFWCESECYDAESNRKEKAYDNLFFHYLPNGELKIRERLLGYFCGNMVDFTMASNMNKEFSRYRDSIVFSLRGKVPVYLSGYTLEDRMRIASYFGFFSCYSKSFDPFTSFYSELKENPSFVQFIETNDYFGLEGLKEIVDKYK